MRGSFWVILCGKSGYPDGANIAIVSTMIDPNSCMNHLPLISIDLFFIISIFIIFFASKTRPANLIAPPGLLRLLTAGLAAVLSLGYLSLGSWVLVQNLSSEKTILPLHGWLVLLFNGLTWGFVCVILSFRRLFPGNLMKPCLGFLSLYAVFISTIALQQVTAETASAKVILDIFCSPEAVLLLVCAFRGHTDDEHENPEAENEQKGSQYMPLEDDDENTTTPFARAGFLSRMSFSWLNPLMKKGKNKILNDADIPKLAPDHRAERCYHDFTQKLVRQKAGKEPTSNAQILLPTIFSWQKKGIIISGFFALIKVLTLSTGPLFLRAFINIAEGRNEAVKYQGVAVTALLFLAKTLESLSERQWCFRTRLIGLQLRSMLSAAVYHKQLRLSNEAKKTHSPGEIINYLTVDAYRIGEFPFWFHQMWTVCLQMCIALAIIYTCVGPAAIAAVVVIALAVVGNSPLGKLQHKYQTGLMVEQDRRLRAITEALFTMKVLKLHAWETSFKRAIERLRGVEFRWLSGVVLQKGGYYMILFWSFPILMSVATFAGCCFFGVDLNAANVFTFLATLRVVQDPVRLVPDVVGAYVQASVSLGRIARFLDAPELHCQHVGKKETGEELQQAVVVRCMGISWENCFSKMTLRNIDFVVKPGEKVAVCGEVGAGKSTLLAVVLGEVPNITGTVLVYGKIAYVSQTAWIQTGTIRDNILFGSPMDPQRYRHTLEKCSLVKDIEMLPSGDLTIIGERGVNLSGGQKQRVQLARALYQDADVYLLDDPFSAVDAHTASNLFNEYVMGALCEKTVLLVTHQVDFLPAVDAILLIVEGQIINSGTYEQLMGSSTEFRDLVNAHSETIRSNKQQQNKSPCTKTPGKSMAISCNEEQAQFHGDQLIQQEERETGDNGLKPYIEYLRHGRGYLYSSMAVISHILFLLGQSIQNYWLATNVQSSDSKNSELKLVTVYSVIGCSLMIFLLTRSFSIVSLSLDASRSIFSTLLNSLFRAPMSFFDATPLGRILSRVSSDMNIIDLDVAMMISMTLASTLTTYFSFGVMAFFTWEVLFVIVPVVYLTLLIQKYYFASAKELMRINGTTKSTITSNLGEAISGASTIRAFGKEDEFFSTAVKLIDNNASPFFHSFSANEWLIQRLEMLCTAILSCSALALTLVPYSKSNSGFIGMALSYGLTLNTGLVSSVQAQCMLANMIVSAERLAQYMQIPSEAPEIVEENRPASDWPDVGKVQICDLKVRYRPNGPLVIRGISCIFEGGDKIGIVGRTGSGKTTLISTLFRLVEPSEGKIVIDGIDISTIGLHDLRTNLGIIPQEPTLFSGSVRYNLDPLSQHTDQEIWQVLEKCQLREAVQEKEGGLESSVIQDGSNWSMGQRQLFCLGRALLKRRKILVLDEATASIDNATDAILQKAIRSEFADCTVITVAHRIPTVMDCTKVLAVSDGKVAEFDEPVELISKQGSLFGQLVREYWSYARNGN